jgi:alpha-glucosidase
MAATLGPHADGSALHVSDQRPKLGDTVTVRVRVPSGSGVRTVRVRVLRDGEPAFVDATSVSGDDVDDWYAADVELHNPVTRYRFQLDRGDAGTSWLNGLGEQHRDVSDAFDFWLTAYDPGPDWGADAVVYQIFPDRFARSDAVRLPPVWAKPAEWHDRVLFEEPDNGQQWFGGDLDGIRDHLDHLRELGVDTVYLTPVFPAGSVHRYDATSFARVDPLLGGDPALIRLSEAVHGAGMRLVGDLTTNHSGDTHEWFTAALGDPAAVERSFYYMGPDGEYVSWLGHASLPKLDLASEELRRRMFGPEDSVLTRWLLPPFNLDGWRIDVANMTGRYGEHDHGRSVATLIRQTLDAVAPESVLLAEYTSDYTRDLVGDGWQGSMNYSGFRNPVAAWLVGDEFRRLQDGLFYGLTRRPGPAVVATMQEFLAGVPWKVAVRHWNLTSSHDVARIRTVTGSAELTRVAAVLLFTYVGVPMIFAGDELGLTGTTGEDARRPMPWSETDEWDAETFAAYRDLIRLRQSSPVLRSGGLRWVLVQDDVLGYVRESADDRILVVVARGPWSPAVVPLAASAAEKLYGAFDLEPGDGLRVSGSAAGAGIWRLT